MSTAKQLNDNTFSDAANKACLLAQGDRCVFTGLSGASGAYFLAKSFLATKQTTLVILPDEESAEGFANDLKFFLGSEKILFYPSSELLPFETQSIHPEISAKRLLFLYQLLTENKHRIAVTAAPNLLERVLPRTSLKNRVQQIELGSEYERDTLLVALHAMGYNRVSMVEDRGEISVRGGIIDIYPPAEKYPFRIEFFGDEVESIRTFDPGTQRSQKELLEALILPARQADLSFEARTRAREKLLEQAEEQGMERSDWEPLYARLREGTALNGVDMLLPLFYERLTTIFDYLPSGTILNVIDQAGINKSAENLAMEINARAEIKKHFVAPDELYINKDSFDRIIHGYPVIELSPFSGKGTELHTVSNFDLRQDITLKKDLSPLTERIKKWTNDEGMTVYLTAHNRGQAERMTELLEGFSTVVMESTDVLSDERTLERAATVRIVIGTISGTAISGNPKGVAPAMSSQSAGFRIPEQRLALITEEEVFGRRVKRRPPQSRKLDSFLTQLKDLSEGDFLVHATHGVGIYRGLKRLSNSGVESDFLLAEYQGGDKLYLPVEKMDLISKYHGVEGRSIEPDRLGKGGWEKKKTRAKKAIRKIAGQLIKLYSERKIAKGHAFSAPGHMFGEFEAGFEYDETPDQERAIEEVMDDMGQPKAMDRLVCGDVGYGKTEVAMRGAFRAVLDAKQVAILVPTTVLAQQHYLTFTERFAPYPVTVDVLSRFKTRKEQAETLSALREGKVDIVIGTHRLLQKDIVFKNLGLLVIDEEHRFGVTHKEKLKELKKEVDVMTLTATPIPRTLHMSLSDVRDMSIINTPPEDRLAITTRIISFDEMTIREAIERELKRGGQVFFVHNRVQSIAGMFERIKMITEGIKPDMKIGVAHGQMKPAELEEVMLNFCAGKYDILLTTTIIESGLDIPSANTIIINRADRFGLAELYQLRGRVGRSNHRAYAYLVCPDDATLTHDARKRMDVIRNLSELGSGFRIAAYDLEIRGAGEMLGGSQSGHISEVGFEMYTELLSEAVSELRGSVDGSEIEKIPQAEINLTVSQFIPDDYVYDPRERLGTYKRLATTVELHELDTLTEELNDRYGTLPEVVENLFQTTRLKLELGSLGADELSQRAGRLYLGFSDSAKKGNNAKIADTGERILNLIKNNPDSFRLTKDEKLVYSLAKNQQPIEGARYMLKALTKEC